VTGSGADADPMGTALRRIAASTPGNWIETVNRATLLGLPPTSADGTRSAPELDHVREWIAAVQQRADRATARRGAATVAYLDGTTLATAAALTAHPDSARRFLTPATLLDLSTVIKALVWFDAVVYLDNASTGQPVARLTSALGADDVIQPALDAATDLSATTTLLQDHFVDAHRELCRVRTARPGALHHGARQALETAWSTLLDGPTTALELIDPHLDSDFRTNSPDLLDQLVAARPGLGAGVDHPAAGARPPGRPDPLLAELNLRAAFHVRVAAMLGMPYLPNAARLPARGAQYRQAVAFHRQLSVVREVETALERQGSGHPDGADEFPVPVLLAVVLRRCTTLDDVWPAVAELRHEARRFRRYRREQHEVLSGRGRASRRKLARLGRAVRNEAAGLGEQLVRPSTAALSIVLTQLYTGSVELAVAGVALLKVVEALTPDARAAVSRRLLRPHEWFLTDLGGEVAALRDVVGEVQRLWGIDQPTLDAFGDRLPAYRQLGYS
jgi:hypothetical protein